MTRIEPWTKLTSSEFQAPHLSLRAQHSGALKAPCPCFLEEAGQSVITGSIYNSIAQLTDWSEGGGSLPCGKIVPPSVKSDSRSSPHFKLLTDLTAPSREHGFGGKFGDRFGLPPSR